MFSFPSLAFVVGFLAFFFWNPLHWPLLYQLPASYLVGFVARAVVGARNFIENRRLMGLTITPNGIYLPRHRQQKDGHQPVSKEELSQLFPNLFMGTVHGLYEVSRIEAAQRVHALNVRKGNVLNWTNPENSGAIDLVELRCFNKQNGQLVEVGPLYFNYYYLSNLEHFHDFTDGDAVTVLFQRGKRSNDKPRPEFIYNHETHVLVKCIGDLSLLKETAVVMTGAKVPQVQQKFAAQTAETIATLQETGVIPRPGNQPRLRGHGRVPEYAFSSSGGIKRQFKLAQPMILLLALGFFIAGGDGIIRLLWSFLRHALTGH